MTSVIKRSNGSGLPTTSFTGLVDKVFQDNLSRFFNDDYWGFTGLNRSVNVPVNIRETDKSYELELIAPGLRKEDFKVHVNRDVLTVSFEHKEESQEQTREEGWMRREYKTQSFTRSFSLDDNADANQISAKYADGILSLSIGKKEGTQTLSRAIEIS